MKPLYIFDLDGTLALIAHRKNLIDGVNKNWDAFYLACKWDEPNAPVITTLQQLVNAGADVVIWTGRSDIAHERTGEWLEKHGIHCPFVMRKHGDKTQDDTLKMQWYDALAPEDRGRLVAVFEDRDRVVAMWRRKGVACFQVALGSF